MNCVFFKNKNRAQTGIEFLLLFAVVAILAMAAFNKLLPNIQKSQSPQFSPTGFFSQATRAIQGDSEKIQPIDGGWCPIDANSGTGQTASCECPAPAFGGKDCVGNPVSSTCVPQCNGKQCGSDSCGGSCGSCKKTERCTVADQCVCDPQCKNYGRVCGLDPACGVSCGECAAHYTCTKKGQCVCVPDCKNKNCGSDGCGGTCGSLNGNCPNKKYCSSDQKCLPDPVCGTELNACNPGVLIDTPDTNDYYKWKCQGEGGGPKVNCSKIKPVDGVCGTSSWTCAKGTPAWGSAGQFNNTWYCLGLYGGNSSEQCSLQRCNAATVTYYDYKEWAYNSRNINDCSVYGLGCYCPNTPNQCLGDGNAQSQQDCTVNLPYDVSGIRDQSYVVGSVLLGYGAGNFNSRDEIDDSWDWCSYSVYNVWRYYYCPYN